MSLMLKRGNERACWCQGLVWPGRALAMSTWNEDKSAIIVSVELLFLYPGRTGISSWLFLGRCFVLVIQDLNQNPDT